MDFDWLQLDSFNRQEDGERTMAVTIGHGTKLYVESSPNHKDIRINDGDHVVKITLNDRWMINQVLLNDRHIWFEHPEPPESADIESNVSRKNGEDDVEDELDKFKNFDEE